MSMIILQSEAVGRLGGVRNDIYILLAWDTASPSATVYTIVMLE